MKAILGFDTATEDTAVAVMRGDEVVYEEAVGPEVGRPLHGPSLLPMVERAVAAAGGWQQLSRIAVGLGPGSFTGLRVGIATARALGHSSGLEVVGVPTLDALAAADGAGGTMPNANIVAAIDARRGQLFAAVYGPVNDDANPHSRTRVVEPVVCDPEQISTLLALTDQGLPPSARGSGALRFRDQFEAAGMVVPNPSDPLHRVSGRWIASIGGSTPQPAEPIYLRAPDAERWLERARIKKDES